MFVFDEARYLAINEARWPVAAALLPKLPGPTLKTAYDVGCGPGWFSQKLLGLDLEVTGLEVRPELVTEARRRVPGATFLEFDADHPAARRDLPPADLVFCFGLIYHLENPCAAIRNLHALTRHFCVIESIMVADDRPVAQLVEESRSVDQGFTSFALIPSRTAFVKMLYVAGFPYVYEFGGDIAHPDFTETASHHRRRRIVIASHHRLHHRLHHRPVISDLIWCKEPGTPKYQHAK